MSKTLFEILKEVKLDENGHVIDDRPYDMNCVALVAANKRGGVLVHVKPHCALWWEMEEIGTARLDDYGLDLAPVGVSIWEGKAVWSQGGYECPQDGQMDYEGTFRRLTAEEAAKMQAGEPLWPEEEDVDEDEGTKVEGNVPAVRDDLGPGR